MKIKTIYIENFGKLKNFKLDLKPGLNIIYGSNESGKTTVMNFIKMMFYGTAGKSSDINKNMRKKYAPWDGAPMSGYIEFESGGQDFRIEREFGNSNISDNISIWNLSTGSSEAVSCKYDAGERFIGMSLSAFEKSVFIGDVSSVVNGTDKEDEISKKLMKYMLLIQLTVPIIRIMLLSRTLTVLITSRHELRSQKTITTLFLATINNYYERDL